MSADPIRRACLAAALLAPWIAPARADLVSLVAGARDAVLPVGTFNATDNPRFAFRGSGFVVGDGSLVATNAHVIPPPDQVEQLARLAVLSAPREGRREVRAARVVATDREHDLVLLKVEGAPAAPLPLAADDSAREGESVALIGFPVGDALGFSPVTHTGIVSSITTVALPAPTSRQLDPRALARLRNGNFRVLQLDAVIYPGNSGGPLFDVATGRVIGIVNMSLVKGSRESALSTPTGISYAIPVRHLRELLAEQQGEAPPAQTR